MLGILEILETLEILEIKESVQEPYIYVPFVLAAYSLRGLFTGTTITAYTEATLLQPKVVRNEMTQKEKPNKP